MSTETMLVQVPEKLEPVITGDRTFTVLHGGRGSGKSRTVAKKLLIKGWKAKRKILCAREVQKSLNESVLQLLTDEIDRLGLGHFYTVYATEIVGANGTRFIFAGVKSDPNKIKSMEGVTDLWVEEAENVKNRSWVLLLPTIRGCSDASVFVTFNPYSEGDDSYVRWILTPPQGTLVIEVNYDDNPWFPEILRQQMEESRARDLAEYFHVWEGKTIEQAGTTEFPIGNLQEWDADRLDGKNWYLLVDPSGSKKKLTGDFTVMTAYGLGADRFDYIGEWVRDRFSLEEKWAAMVRLNEKYRFKAIGYEDSSGGLERDSFERLAAQMNYRLPLVWLSNTKGKDDRIRFNLVPIVKASRLVIPFTQNYKQLDGTQVDLVKAFRKEMSAFPHIAASLHDDMLDATSRAHDPDLGAVYPSLTKPTTSLANQNRRYDPVTRKLV